MLAMINVAAIGGIRNWPSAAELGLSSVFYLLLATVVFFIPLALISAELATAWPQRGGVFVWVKTAFGHRLGFLAAWLLWTQTVVFYPTVTSFIAGTVAYMINPELAANRLYTFVVVLICLWGATLFNLLGMKASGWFSSLCTVFGIFIPGLGIIALGCLWFFSGHPLQVPVSWSAFFPKFEGINHLVFFSSLILAYQGIEMSAVHAKEVENPTRNYPKAITLSAAIVVSMTILGVLSIVFSIPQGEISLVAGTMQAFTVFLNAYQLEKLVPLFAAMITLGAIGSMSTWIAGPCKGLLAAAEKGDLPPVFRKINKNGMPNNLLIIQGVIITLICLIFLFMPTVSSAYWILSALSVNLYLTMYLLMFAAAIWLRYKHPKHPRPYTVPGGRLGMWISASLGFFSSLFAFIIAFFPPAELSVGNVPFYIGFLVIGIMFFYACPSLILRFKKKSWERKLSHEKL